MCAIAGRVASVPREEDVASCGAMISLLAHRGPDGAAVYRLPSDHTRGMHATFGHRRLRIIDLQSQADQPMHNNACVHRSRAKPLTIVFNGEIYNFKQLRRQQEESGHAFQSHSDTETILHSYEDYGFDCLKHFRGMFAFALWDHQEQVLFAARDRIGKKPFFYYFDGATFIFASEPRAILIDWDVRTEPDPESIDQYLTFGYVPQDRSAFRRIKKLPPGHFLVLKDQKLTVERYWKLSYANKIRISETEAAEEIRRRLHEAVKLRMESDVPIGAFLSGGIDSSAIVAAMSDATTTPVRTFSIGFDDHRYTELKYAKIIAERFGTEHEEFIVRPDALRILPRLVWHYGEPFADSSAIPSFYLAEMTRRRVTVALNGDGGDENFAGYDRYAAVKLASYSDHFPVPVRRASAWLIGRLRTPDQKTFTSRLRRFISASPYDPVLRYAQWIGYFANGTRENFYTPEFQGKVRRNRLDLLHNLYEESDGSDLVEATLDVDVNLYLPDDLLVKMDIATMAHGLETRSPLLDQEFMEFVAALPVSFKLRRREQKYILKKALHGTLPAEILNRPKMGFGVPLDNWFRSELKNFAYEILLSPRCIHRGYVKPAKVQQLLDEHASAQANHQHLLWNLLMLELWHRTYIDGRDWTNGPVAF